MAVGQAPLHPMHPVPGLRLGTTCAGIRKPGRKDLVLIELAEGSQCAGVFTRNAFCAAPVTVAREHLERTGGQVRYLLVNTGNANAGTGQRGLDDARASCEAVAREMGVAPEQVLPFSTGVIGEHLPMDVLRAGIPGATSALDGNGWADAAEGIMTTDTRPKGVSTSFTVASTPAARVQSVKIKEVRLDTRAGLV